MRATVVGLTGTEGVDHETTESITSAEAADTFGQKIALKLVDLGAGKILDDINAERRVPETVK